MSPQTNYAIGGTVNFRTKEPTYHPTPEYTLGFDSRGGTYSNFGFSNTIGRLGFVVDVATLNDPSSVNGQQLDLQSHLLRRGLPCRFERRNVLLRSV